MKRITSVLFAAMLLPAGAWACTGLIAGAGATVDGSVMITYSADSHTLYGALTSTPAADWQPGDMRQIVEWDTGKPLGAIPQVPHTYAVNGNMIEHQLAIVESTWGGRPELVDTLGLIDYGTLIQLGLERARTAREAIQVMTDLVKEYGYYSSGESFSIADPNEAWIMEMIGKGSGRKGAVWVAIRIPDDCISGHANHPRIHQFPLDDPENCLYSPDVISFAREEGYFNGRGDHNSRLHLVFFRQVSDRRGRDHAHIHRVRAHAADSRHQRVREHISRNTGIASHHDGRTMIVLPGQDRSSRLSELHRQGRRQLFVRHSSYSVCSK